jgi:hypothetical protein
MGRHYRRTTWTNWAWDWEGGRRSLSLAGWLAASWLLVGVLWIGLTIRDRTWHTDTTWVDPVRVTLTEKDQPR